MAKLDFTFNTGDTPVSKIVDAIANEYGYRETIIDDTGKEIPNPQNKAQFAKHCIKNYIIGIVRKADLLEVSRVALQTVRDIELD